LAILTGNSLQKFWVLGVLAGFLALILGILMVLPGSPTERLRLGLTDYLYLLELDEPDMQPLDEIVVIAIDDASLAQYGRWPWARSLHAELINRLSEAGVAAIGLDITLSESSSESSEDDALAAALAAADNVALTARLETPVGAVLPIEKFATAKTLGFADLTVDTDNVVRRSETAKSVNDSFGSLESLALAVTRIYLGRTAEAPKQPYLAEGYLYTTTPNANPPYPATVIPLDPSRRYYINFFGKPGSYRYISATAVLTQDPATMDLADKIALIGVTPDDLRDLEPVPTSFGQKMPGVEIHANAVQTLLTGKYLILQSIWARLTIVIVLTLGGVLLFWNLRLRNAVLVLVALLSGWFFLAHWFFHQGLILDLLHPALALLLVFVGTYLYRFVFVDREKRHLKTAFGHYLAPALVERLSNEPGELKLGGENRELTMLFSDIAGFTSISEKLSAEELVTLLNRYLGEMTEIVMNSGGTLDKYIGDAVMAFWGAPLPDAEHARHACYAALDQMAALRRLHESGIIPKETPLSIRIGLNTAAVVVGNMGSSKRFNYTVMGDGVNLASRLEGVNKEYGTEIIISESTYVAVREAVVVRELDMIKVKGKQTGVRIYELLAKAGEATERQLGVKSAYETALAAYRSRAWDTAIGHLAAVQKLSKTDGPTLTLLQRIEKYKQNPPPPGWDGTHTMTSK
jgi:adenylate cyclase